MRPLARTFVCLLLGMPTVTGCRTNEVPSVVVLDRSEYARSFDAAVETLRDAGMTTAVRDREGGLIETEPRRAGTLLEPWRGDNAGLGQAAENTIATHRRRVRFEFVSTEFAPSEPSADEVLRGPDIDSAQGRAATPLTAPGAPIEMRIWVDLEQSFTPNVRRFLWTRELTTQAFEVNVPIDPREGVEVESLWTPVGRDEAYERRLMAMFLDRMGWAGSPQGEAEPTRSADPPSGTPHPPPG